jgi:hypothetical protein
MQDNIAPATYKYLYVEEGREAESLENNEKLTPTSLVIRDEKKGVFMHFESLADYASVYAGTEYLTHEVIFSWQKQRPKFDIDGGDASLFDDILMNIEAFFWETFEIAPEIV